MPYDKNSPTSIQSMFGSIASSYDKTNSLMSFRLHKRWNAELVEQVTLSTMPEGLLDLCCGTGDIAFEYLKKAEKSQKITLLDFCPEMLECAKEKAGILGLSRHSISYVQGDAHDLPLEKNSVPRITMAYGIRNVKNPSKCIQEAFRVLQPGGLFGILELTKPSHPLIKYGHSLYLKTMVPLLGKLAASNKEAYRYLCQSIHHFVAPGAMQQMMERTGFIHTRQIPLTYGIATILVGQKK